MDSVVCGESAFAVWRTPPLVRLLVDPLFRGTGTGVSLDRLASLRTDLMAERGLWRTSAGLHARGPAVSLDVAEGVMLNLRTLMASVEAPVDVLVASREERRPSRLLRPHVKDARLVEGELRPLGSHLSLTSPALTLLQLARGLSLPRLVAAVSEACGTFAVYRAPGPVASLVEEMAAGAGVPEVGGWRPSFDGDGRLTDLWSRPALTTPGEIAALAARARGQRGRRALARAAELAVPGAASPFEVQTGMLLGLDSDLGGEGLGGFSHNERIVLGGRAREIARQDGCRCDLLWPGEGGRGPLDVECHSRTFHLGEDRSLSDADRALALQSMGVEVLFVTYAQIAGVRRFDALARTVAEKLGRDVTPRTTDFLAARAELRREVLVDFADLLA